MIITIIVMLILAGVSINAIVGDNGILSQATSATYATSIAVLQEYLQELYVENYDSLNASESKVVGLSNLSAYSGYFYNPSTDSQVGSLPYVVDSNGYALYLIKKSELPKEIQDQLVGGNAGDGTYSDYASLNDVYGVTSDLKVYYCSNGVDTIQGITVAELDVDNPARSVTISNALATLLGIDANTTAQTLRAYKTLTIDSTISSLSDLYNFSNLQVLILDGANLSSLSGIENCPLLYEVYCKSSTIGDYTAIGKLGSRLTHLYFYNIDDEELENACSDLSNYDLPKLTYLAVVGNTKYISSTSISSTYYSSKNSEIYSVSALSKLTSTTKQAVRYLSLQNNYLSSLDGISSFTGVTVLRCEYNLLGDLDDIFAMTNLSYLICSNNSSLTISNNLTNMSLYLIDCCYCESISSLSFLENCSSITYIYADYCTIGYGETSTKNEKTDSLVVLNGKTSLYYLSLTYNTNLAWIDYISSCSNLNYLYLEGCTGLNSTSMYAIKTLLANLGTNCSYPSSYSLALLNDDTTLLDLTGETLTKDEFETIGKYTGITHLSLKNVVIWDEDNDKEITNDTNNELDNLVIEVLSNLSAMQYLQLYGMSNLSTIDFVENMEGLLELDVRDTSVTDLSILEEMTSDESLALGCLAVNVEDTDLSSICKTISYASLNIKSYWVTVPKTDAGGLLCENASVLESLEDSDIEALYLCYGTVGNSTLDLSDCEKLYFFESCYSSIYFYFPSSLTQLISYGWSGGEFETGTELDSFILRSPASNEEYLWSCIGECSVVKSVSIYTSGGVDLSLAFYYLSDVNLESFSSNYLSSFDASEFEIPYTLKSLSVGASGYKVNGIGTTKIENMPYSIISSFGTSLTTLEIDGTTIASLEFLNDLTSLKSITLIGNVIQSLEEVTTELTNVTSLNLSYNSITSLQGIQYFTGLTTLNLSNNSLVNTASYNGTYNNLELLIDLLEAGTLKILDISSNSSINKETTQWTTLLSYNGTNGIKITY